MVYKVTFFLSVAPERFLTLVPSKEVNGNFMIGEGDIFVVPFRCRGRSGVFGYRVFCAKVTNLTEWLVNLNEQSPIQFTAVEYDVMIPKDWISDLKDRPLLQAIDEVRGLYRSMNGINIVVVDQYLNLQLRAEKGKGTLEFLKESMRSLDVLIGIEDFEKESELHGRLRTSS
ncbi:hypothetical protein AB3N04_00990 (plasmid) [Alkalihalophilus sp. As8PL]|uniref:Uncharacterized protein n=1 Tax=Alkalihalophilus sp. As8PL TaxID=3237103 RepID=A0AB39BNM8_9BACI